MIGRGRTRVHKHREQVHHGKMRLGRITLLRLLICSVLWEVPSECDIGADDYKYWDLRLVNGETPLDGTPVMFINDDWVPLCDKYITTQVAKVICRQLGFPPDVLRKNPRAVNKSYIRCSGNERLLLAHCHWTVIHKEPCAADDMQGIICTGNIRLDGGNTDTSGTIQVFRKKQWHALCDIEPDYKVAQVVCRQLDYEFDNPVLYMQDYYYGNNLDVIAGRYECLGHEPNLDNCTYTSLDTTCDKGKALGIECNGTAMSTTFVYGYSDSLSGRISINLPVESGYWCGLGQDNYTEIEQTIAAVICYETGFSRYGADAVYYEFDGRDSEPLMDVLSVVCTGKERRLSDCVRRYQWGNTDCYEMGAGEIGVQCQRAIRLVDGTSSDNGRLEIIDDVTGQWTSLSDINADQSLAKVVCRQLDIQSPSVATLHAIPIENHASPTESWQRVLCSGGEELLGDCQVTEIPPAVADMQGHVLGVTCKASPRQVRAVPHPTIDGYGYIEVEEGGEWLTVCYPTRFPYYQRTNMAMVLCHQLGFMRLAAELIPYDSYTPADGRYGDLLSSTRCTGKEEHISNCSRQHGYTGTEKCDLKPVGYSCLVTETAPVKVDPVKKEIKCFDNYCLKRNCSDNKNAEIKTCPFNGRNGCRLQKSIDSVNNLENVFMHCSSDDCMPEFTPDDFQYRYVDCCYTDLCNSATDRTFGRSHMVVRMVDGWVPSEGDIQIFRNNEWMYITIDGNVSTSTSAISYICSALGYHYSTVARRPARELYEGTCVSGLEFAQCMDSPGHGSLKACGGVMQQCNGTILSIDCNVRRPQYRLMDGGARHMGRVEVFYHGAWGTICRHGRFDYNVANSICATLGYPLGASLTSKRLTDPLFRGGNGTIHFVNLNCDDWLQQHDLPPDNILLCDYHTHIPAQCDHSNDVGVICETIVLETTTVPPAAGTTTNPKAHIDMYLGTTSTAASVPNSGHPVKPGRNETIKGLFCYTGTCGQERSCSLKSESCSGVAFCISESRRLLKGNMVSTTYGCNPVCVQGTKRKTQQIEETRCCSQPLCNDPAITDPTTIPGTTVAFASVDQSTPALIQSAAMSAKSRSAHVICGMLMIIFCTSLIG